jgi:hypothetical protein
VPEVSTANFLQKRYSVLKHWNDCLNPLLLSAPAMSVDKLTALLVKRHKIQLRLIAVFFRGHKVRRAATRLCWTACGMEALIRRMEVTGLCSYEHCCGLP